MNVRRISALVLRQYYLLRGSPARILPLFVWVLIDIVLWGFITKYLSSIGQSTFSVVPALLGAVLMWDFFARVMHGVTTAFFEDVWARNFLNVFASPLTISEYVCSLVVTSIGTSLVCLVAMLGLATGCFGFSMLDYGSAIVPFLLILFLFGIALGILGASIVLRLGPASEWFVWPIPAILSPFAGVFYPLSTLPKWMQIVGATLPPSHVFEQMRALLGGAGLSAAALGVAFSLAVGWILVAAMVFTSVFRGAVRSGLIARYSAETVN